jgi:glutathione synthase/RimK-type ligase-like ATP-grasp enzyme
VVVDAAELEQQPYALYGPQLQVGEEELMLDLSDGVRGWIRRLAPPQWRPNVVSGSHDSAVRTAWTALVVGLAGDADVEWLTPLERLFLCESKLLQERAARKLGILTPQTAVTSERSLIPAELGQDLVAKPLGTSHYSSQDATEQVIWTKALDVSAPELDLLAGAPFILQARLEAERHLRVVTVRERAWVCELDAAGLELDWRGSEEAHHSFTSASEPEVAEKARALAAVMGVGYSSQDWIVSDGDPYFLDLNPAGQWLFLPEPAVSDITESIAEWLTGGMR